jgi:sugar O-acyltransferase (sialic acid O-acetyltransferase NeuD family)
LAERVLGVYGASGCGRGVMPLVRAASAADPARLTFVDDGAHPSMVNGESCMDYASFRALPGASKSIVLAISDSRIRERLAVRCAADGLGFFEVRASNVVVMDEVTIGEGAILSPFVTITSNVRIGRHFHANLYSYVEHDCVIGDFVTFAPGVHCNGNIVIEDHAYVGAGAMIKQGKPGRPLTIGRGAIVGMGAVVTRDVPPGATVVGNPARPIR